MNAALSSRLLLVVLLALAGACNCGRGTVKFQPDGGKADAAHPDGGGDAGAPDAALDGGDGGLDDGGNADAGNGDAGTDDGGTDAGFDDGGPTDGGADAGASDGGGNDGGAPLIDALTSTVIANPTLLTADGVGLSTITVTVMDAVGNPIPGATVVLSATGLGNTLVQPAAPTDASGVATGTLVSTVAEAKTLSATADDGAGPVALQNRPVVVFVAGPPASLFFKTQPSTAVAGTAIVPAVEVALLDAQGNLCNAATDPVTLALATNPGGGSLFGTLTVAAVNGVAVFPNLSIDRAAAGYQLLATSETLPAATSAAFDILAGAGTQLVFTVQPSPVVATSAIVPAVEVAIEDAYGNLDTNAIDTVTLAIGNNPAGGTLAGTTAVTALGGLASFPDLRLDRAGVGYTLAASAPGLPGTASNAFDVLTGTVDAFVSTVVASPTQLTADGVSYSTITVTARDAAGNPVSGRTVVLAASGSSDILVQPAGPTDASGVATGTLASTHAEAKRVTATFDPGAGQVIAADQPTVTFVAGPPASLVFITQPTSTSAGTPLSPAPAVAFLDASGNVCTQVTVPVDVTLDVNPGGAVLSGTTPQLAAAGVATFPGLSLDKAAIGYVLRASGGAFSVTSAPFDIAPGAAASLAFRTQPSSISAGAPFTPAVQVELQDAFGNLATGASAPVTLAIGANPGGGSLLGSTSAAPAGGVATFPGLSLDKVGAGYTLVAASGALPAATSAPFDVSAGAASQLAFVTQPSDADAGAAIAPAPRLAVEDAFGNLIAGSTATIAVSLAANPGGGSLSGTLSRAAAGGFASFPGLSIDKAAAGYALLAQSPGLASATSAPFTIRPGAAAQLAFLAGPSDADAGAAIAPPVRVAVEDALGNVVTSSSLSIGLAIGTNPGGGTLSGTNPQMAVGGVASFANLSIDRSGVGYTLVASGGGLPAATSGTFTIRPGTAAALAFDVAPGPIAAGSPFAPVVQVSVRDGLGNLVTASSASISLAIAVNPGGGALLGTATQAASGGVASFPGLSIDKAGIGYTLTASSAGLSPVTSAPFNVSAGAAVQLAFVTQPSNTVAGAAIAPSVRIAVEDAYGNVVTASVAALTVAIAANPGGGTLAGTLTQNAVSGVATFPNLSIDKAAAGYTLGGSSGALTPATSAAFRIVNGPPAQLAFTVDPTNTVRLAPIAPAPRVSVEDAFGNLVPTATNSITLSLAVNPSGGNLLGSLTSSAVGGVATFANLQIDTAGSGYRLGAAAAGLAGGTSAAFDVTPSPLQLVYTDPAPGKKIRLVKNPSSTGSTMILDLVANAALTGYSVGMNLPLDTGRVQLDAVPMVTGTALLPGSSPAAAAAVIRGSGPLSGVLASGQSQKAAGAGAIPTDSSVAVGQVFYSVRLDLRGTATVGTVFDGAALGAAFAAAMRDRAGNDTVLASEFAIGRLEVQ